MRAGEALVLDLRPRIHAGPQSAELDVIAQKVSWAVQSEAHKWATVAPANCPMPS